MIFVVDMPHQGVHREPRLNKVYTLRQVTLVKAAKPQRVDK